jgi:hypothetical protein
LEAELARGEIGAVEHDERQRHETEEEHAVALPLARTWSGGENALATLYVIVKT